MPEPIWNVKLPVVEPVSAASADEAVEKLRRRLDAAGLYAYINAGEDSPDAFESEPIDGEIEGVIRTEWANW